MQEGYTREKIAHRDDTSISLTVFRPLCYNSMVSSVCCPGSGNFPLAVITSYSIHYTKLYEIIFPVLEPFGSHLADSIQDPALIEKYTFQSLYDSTKVYAEQDAEHNKFKLSYNFV